MNNDKPKEPGVGLMILVAIVAAVIMSTIMGGFRGGSGGGGYSAPSGGPSSSYQGNTYNGVTDRQLDQIENGAAMKQHNHDMLDQFNAQHGLKNGGK